MTLRVIRALSSRPFRRLSRPLMRDRTTIFMGHRISNAAANVHGHQVEGVRGMLDALRESGARFISLEEMVRTWATGGQCDPDAIAFTLDDGFADQGVLARDAFLPMDCPVTIFLITGFIDGNLWPWDDQLDFALKATAMSNAVVTVGGQQISLKLDSRQLRESALRTVREACKRADNSRLYEQVAEIAAALGVQIPHAPPRHHQPLTWDDARALEASGVSFGPHTVSHRIVSQLGDAAVRAELQGSWDRLRQELRRPLPVLAWPTGGSLDFSDKDVRIAQELGLQACVATESDYAHIRREDPAAMFSIKRFPLPSDVGTTLRYGSWLERARQLLPI